MASKKEKRNAIFWLLEAQKLLRESLKVPQLSNNLVEGLDNYPSGSLSVFLMSEDKRGSGVPARVTIWWPTKSRRILCALSVQCGVRRAGFSV
jgi:hypothetical protein